MTFVKPEEVQALLNWFELKGIAYPWGDDPVPYSVWVSEIMLQQTVVSAAVNHFKRWMVLFPDTGALAAASEEEVLRAWEGLGYYSRARNLLKGAQYLMSRHGGLLPDNYHDLIQVPGIGDYTARAVLSMAYGQALPVLDANVRRIGQRLWAMADWTSARDKELLSFLSGLIPRDRPGAFNCALMQLGQQLCRLKSPACPQCPLQRGCQTRILGLQSEIPRPGKRTIKEKESRLLLLCRENSFLLQHRTKGIGRGLWFIPSCLPEEEKTFLEKQKKENTLIDVQDLSPRKHLYTCWKEALFPRLCLLSSRKAEIPSIFNPETGRLEWISLKNLSACPAPSVYRKILDEALLKKQSLQDRLSS